MFNKLLAFSCSFSSLLIFTSSYFAIRKLVNISFSNLFINFSSGWTIFQQIPHPQKYIQISSPKVMWAVCNPPVPISVRGMWFPLSHWSAIILKTLRFRFGSSKEIWISFYWSSVATASSNLTNMLLSICTLQELRNEISVSTSFLDSFWNCIKKSMVTIWFWY